MKPTKGKMNSFNNMLSNWSSGGHQFETNNSFIDKKKIKKREALN